MFSKFSCIFIAPDRFASVACHIIPLKFKVFLKMSMMHLYEVMSCKDEGCSGE